MDPLNQKELARFLGLSRQQIRNLEKVGLPHGSKGREKQYPIPASVQWYIDFKVEAAIQRVTPAELLAARVRKTEAEAELAELEVKKQKETLIHVDDIKPLVRGPVEAINRILKAMPQRLAKKWAKRFKTTEAEAIHMVGEVVEGARDHIRDLFSREYHKEIKSRRFKKA